VRENSKLEIRNSKQIQMKKKAENYKRARFRIPIFGFRI